VSVDPADCDRFLREQLMKASGSGSQRSLPKRNQTGDNLIDGLLMPAVVGFGKEFVRVADQSFFNGKWKHIPDRQREVLPGERSGRR
jgi:hypothetical protein